MCKGLASREAAGKKDVCIKDWLLEKPQEIKDSRTRTWRKKLQDTIPVHNYEYRQRRRAHACHKGVGTSDRNPTKWLLGRPDTRCTYLDVWVRGRICMYVGVGSYA